jgi:polysaccharide pyruvyl transferase WcaK-like protein
VLRRHKLLIEFKGSIFILKNVYSFLYNYIGVANLTSTAKKKVIFWGVTHLQCIPSGSRKAFFEYLEVK